MHAFPHNVPSTDVFPRLSSFGTGFKCFPAIGTGSYWEHMFSFGTRCGIYFPALGRPCIYFLKFDIECECFRAFGTGCMSSFGTRLAHNVYIFSCSADGTYIFPRLAHGGYIFLRSAGKAYIFPRLVLNANAFARLAPGV